MCMSTVVFCGTLSKVPFQLFLVLLIFLGSKWPWSRGIRWTDPVEMEAVSYSLLFRRRDFSGVNFT